MWDAAGVGCEGLACVCVFRGGGMFLFLGFGFVGF